MLTHTILSLRIAPPTSGLGLSLLPSPPGGPSSGLGGSTMSRADPSPFGMPGARRCSTSGAHGDMQPLLPTVDLSGGGAMAPAEADYAEYVRAVSAQGAVADAMGARAVGDAVVDDDDEDGYDDYDENMHGSRTGERGPHSSSNSSSSSRGRGGHRRIPSQVDSDPLSSASAAAAAAGGVLCTGLGSGLTAADVRAATLDPTPTKVLEAPGLRDDFYFNVLDWGANNVVSVALASAVFSWSAATEAVSEVFQVPETADSMTVVTGVKWNPTGDILALGLSDGEVRPFLFERLSCYSMRVSLSLHIAYLPLFLTFLFFRTGAPN